jgi:hypothetical protein
MKKINLILCAAAFILTACTKNYLDVKPASSLVVPQTFQDFQALLDNTLVNNINMPSLQEASSDDFYITDDSYSSIDDPIDKNTYTWNKDLYEGNPNVFDWNQRYQQIFYANLVLEGLEKLSSQKGDPRYNSEKGSALFFRAFALFQVSQLFCKPYVAATAATDLGVPVRTTSDINIVTTRSSVQETYNNIIQDLKESIGLLPQTVSVKTRPDQAAAQGLLARVYLSMGDYQDAFTYADAVLKNYAQLLDYNTLSATKAIPFSRYNKEVIFHSTLANTSETLQSRLLVDTMLYRSYDLNDLRRKFFFKPATGGFTFKGNYSGNPTLFNGISVNELYFIRAECNARGGNTVAAMSDLNTLLSTRWATGTFVQFSANSRDEALAIVLTERRKELLLRGLRWSDLRRLNQDTKYAVTLKRNIEGVAYTLPPNDPKYILPIPDLVIQLSGIQQNPR